MSITRKIRRIVTGSTQVDGAGVKLVRVIGHADTQEFDPFLMLDAFDSRDSADYIKGFPWHPHRGIETVTYLIAGDIEHSDSLGNKGTILDGCCQWMTAGSGILHQEMPQASDRMLGVQLWLNLPRKDKMTQPQYRDISASMIPKIRENGCTVGVIAGNYGRTSGATQGDYVQALALDVELEPGIEWRIPTDNEATLFIYIVEGAGYFDTETQTVIESHRAVLFETGEQFIARAADQGVRFLLFSGKPLKEPIAWGGPIVMNTREELQQAFQEIDNGTFIKKR
ncbi:pirin family protein [Sporomusa sp.]|uniref:pirin family protein n=1 Tax=Sporomusa sp. TaxID=2078658 RepID=UPI002BE609C8|nr:pirin family protein [Sporomusa sp.]HWR45453.1 pirin family protein [Sporomusa sp.]